MHRVGLSVSDEVIGATVLDLPGCAYEAPSREAVLSMLPVVIAEHMDWLAAHGETVDSSDTAVEIIEQIDVEGAEGAEGEFVFEDDRRPATDSEIETGIRRMRYARADLLELVDSVSDYVMDWRPPLTAMMRIDSWKPQPLTIREIVSDITGAEGYYMRGLRAGREPAAGSLNEYDLRSGQSALFDRLRSLSEDERGRVYRPIRPWQQAPELWTARKVIRRVISHERFHTAEIRQRIAWIHVGVPDFGAP